MFYLKMKGDYFRYLSEVASGDSKKGECFKDPLFLSFVLQSFSGDRIKSLDKSVKFKLSFSAAALDLSGIQSISVMFVNLLI